MRCLLSVLAVMVLCAADVRAQNEEQIGGEATARTDSLNKNKKAFGTFTPWQRQQQRILRDLGDKVANMSPDERYYQDWVNAFNADRKSFEATLPKWEQALLNFMELEASSSVFVNTHAEVLAKLNRDKPLKDAIEASRPIIVAARQELENSTTPSAISMPKIGEPLGDVPGGEIVSSKWHQLPPRSSTVGVPVPVSAEFRNNTDRRIYMGVTMVVAAGRATVQPTGERKFWIGPGETSGVYGWTIQPSAAGEYTVKLLRDYKYSQDAR